MAKTFCYNDKMLVLSTKRLVAAAKFLVAAAKILIVPYFVAVTKPFFPWRCCGEDSRRDPQRNPVMRGLQKQCRVNRKSSE